MDKKSRILVFTKIRDDSCFVLFIPNPPPLHPFLPGFLQFFGQVPPGIRAPPRVFSQFFAGEVLCAAFASGPFADMGLKKGTYVWEVEVIYEGLKGMERKTGEITMQ